MPVKLQDRHNYPLASYDILGELNVYIKIKRVWFKQNIEKYTQKMQLLYIRYT